jgi:transcriptional regulator with XRE-family HTH domain
MTRRGTWLADALVDAGMSAEDLAKECKPVMDKSYVYKVMRGERLPGVGTLRRMVIVLAAHGVSLEIHEVLGIRR